MLTVVWSGETAGPDTGYKEYSWGSPGDGSDLSLIECTVLYPFSLFDSVAALLLQTLRMWPFLPQAWHSTCWKTALWRFMWTTTSIARTGNGGLLPSCGLVLQLLNGFTGGHFTGVQFLCITFSQLHSLYHLKRRVEREVSFSQQTLLTMTIRDATH